MSLDKFLLEFMYFMKENAPKFIALGIFIIGTIFLHWKFVIGVVAGMVILGILMVTQKQVLIQVADFYRKLEK